MPSSRALQRGVHPVCPHEPRHPEELLVLPAQHLRRSAGSVAVARECKEKRHPEAFDGALWAPSLFCAINRRSACRPMVDVCRAEIFDKVGVKI
jgi:hypothetical protein